MWNRRDRDASTAPTAQNAPELWEKAAAVQRPYHPPHIARRLFIQDAASSPRWRSHRGSGADVTTKAQMTPHFSFVHWNESWNSYFILHYWQRTILMLTLVACYYAYYFLWLFNFWDEDCYLAVRIWTQNETTAMNPVWFFNLFFYIDILFLRIDTVSPNKISRYSRVLIFSYTPIHFVVSDERISQRIQSANALGDETACYIDDSSERLWLHS